MDFVLYFLDYIQLKIEHNYYFSLIIFLSLMILYNSFSLPGNPIFMTSAGFLYGIIKFIFSALLNKPKNLMNRKNYT